MKAKKAGWNLDDSYGQLPSLFFTRIRANTVSLPKLQVFNDDLGKILGLNIEILKSKEGISILAGNQFPQGASQIAQAYAGHQFGHFTMLGDGRAVLIGEQITPKGERVDIQLKGSGRTPYSRGGDGRAALGPMLREYIISESMHSLGIPTTRSLAVVTTGDPVFRENTLPGAVLTRAAASHIRVGTFEYASNFGTLEDVKTLADYTISRHFAKIQELANPYLALLKEVIKSQAFLIAKWQSVGFIHGVMNTDNMTISGETIDYGPCAFMDIYNPSTVFSSIDRNGRYAYGNQPNIGLWNLTRFAETLLPLIDQDEKEAIKTAKTSLEEYSMLYHGYWLKCMGRKLGILNEQDEDLLLINQLLKIMEKYQADFTNTFLGLTANSYQSLDQSGLFKSKEFKDWNEQWQTRLKKQNLSLVTLKESMESYNPTMIPRNHQVEKVLKLATEKRDDMSFKNLLKALKTPYDYNNINEEYIIPAGPSKIPYRTFCGT